MCGFVGFISKEYSNNYESILKIMTDKIIHRGPDDFGVWSDPKSSLHLGFRRLAILDLSEAGHQPMKSFSGRYVILFNGEIYNSFDLRASLEKEFNSVSWRGRSDTEVLLMLIEKYGLKKALKKCVGMFALTLWDRQEKVLNFARDRFGEKPLYYGWSGDNFLFGSDLASLKSFPSFNNDLCPRAIGLFLSYSYVPSPFCIYQNYFKVEPGQIVSVKITSGVAKINSFDYFWKLDEEIKKSKYKKFQSFEEGMHELNEVLLDSVRLQMISDVPIGAFLSGGIDSSLIAAIMQQQSTSSVKTFTIGFENQQFDESPYAKKVADFLGTNHTEATLTEEDAIRVIPEIPKIYSEPFADSSQIPTYLVSSIAKTSVTVSLSGDGGDELFGGYNRYFWGDKIWSKVNWIPFSARKVIGKTLSMTPEYLNNLTENFLQTVSRKKGINRLNDKVQKIAYRLQHISSKESLYTSLCTEWDDVNVLLTSKYQSLENSKLNLKKLDELSDIENMMYWDLDTYLKEDILTKVDRAAMAHSLETRAPFLDFRVAECAWRFNDESLISGYTGKMPLRRLLESYIPKDLFERPKSGFGIPVGIWLKGPLRDWAESLLDFDSIKREGILDYSAVNDLWIAHLNGSSDNTVKLWNILMFRSWMAKNTTK